MPQAQPAHLRHAAHAQPPIGGGIKGDGAVVCKRSASKVWQGSPAGKRASDTTQSPGRQLAACAAFSPRSTISRPCPRTGIAGQRAAAVSWLVAISPSFSNHTRATNPCPRAPDKARPSGPITPTRRPLSATKTTGRCTVAHSAKVITIGAPPNNAQRPRRNTAHSAPSAIIGKTAGGGVGTPLVAPGQAATVSATNSTHAKPWPTTHSGTQSSPKGIRQMLITAAGIISAPISGTAAKLASKP